MGYACPVCGAPQADAGHLANHLGFTAVARGGDHEDWLDEHVPGWAEKNEAGLAEEVLEFAEETEFPQVFEDTTGRPGGGGHDHHEHASEPRGDLPGDGVPGTDAGFEAAMNQLAGTGVGDLDPEEIDEIVQRARDLTRERREDSETE